MLSIKDLTLHYGHSQILYGVSMEAAKGEVTCVMGTNGVGKTSLIKAISGTHLRSGGQMMLDGEDLGRLPAHALVHKGVAIVRTSNRLQLEGLTDNVSLQTTEVIDAILKPEGAHIAAVAYEWSGYQQQDTIVSWTVLDTPDAIRRFTRRCLC